MHQYRLQHPPEYLTSAFVHPRLHGDPLTAEELGSFFVLLAEDEKEDTRKTISNGIRLLSEYSE